MINTEACIETFLAVAERINPRLIITPADREGLRRQIRTTRDPVAYEGVFRAWLTKLRTAQTPAELAPIIHCRGCGQVLEAKFQPCPDAPEMEFYHLTCRNQVCRLEGQTFSNRGYATKDLSAYKKAAATS